MYQKKLKYTPKVHCQPKQDGAQLQDLEELEDYQSETNKRPSDSRAQNSKHYDEPRYVPRDYQYDSKQDYYQPNYDRQSSRQENSYKQPYKPKVDKKTESYSQKQETYQVKSETALQKQDAQPYQQAQKGQYQQKSDLYVSKQEKFVPKDYASKAEVEAPKQEQSSKSEQSSIKRDQTAKNDKVVSNTSESPPVSESNKQSSLKQSDTFNTRADTFAPTISEYPNLLDSTKASTVKQSSSNDYPPLENYGDLEYDDYGFDEFNEKECLDFKDPEDLQDELYPEYYKYSNKVHNVLMVAEKPSIAKSIAQMLSDNKSISKKGISPVVPIHYFQGQIFGSNCNFIVTSVAGHVYARDFPPKYADWHRVNPADLFDAETIKKEANPKQRIVKHLKQLSKNCSYLVLWLDNDREGENICFEVIDICQPQMAKLDNGRRQIYRALFSSITHSEIKQTFQNLRYGPNENESIAVDARQIIDLKIGVAFSRQQTLYFQKQYTQLRDKMLTFGPCQTPTLSFCVERYSEKHNFVPRLYWTFQLKLETPKIVARMEERIFSQQQALTLQTQLQQQAAQVKVKSVQTTQSSQSRPTGLNTVTLLKICSSAFGIGPQETMHLAERLYLEGYISYPRTESTHYSEAFDFQGVLNCLSNQTASQKVQEYSNLLQQKGLNKPKQGLDMGDHPPITPTNKCPSGFSNSSLHQIYELVCKIFLASVGTTTFYYHSIIVEDLGFTAIMEWKQQKDGITSFGLTQGQILKNGQISMNEDYTTAPDYLSESDLISLMEKHGIGTDASMATHINNIGERGYVTVESGRRLVPTKIGLSLVLGYQKIDKDLVVPELRSDIERRVDQIAKGKLSIEVVLKETLDIYRIKLQNLVKNLSMFDTYFEKFMTPVGIEIENSKNFSLCGKCNRLMKLADKAYQLVCDHCNLTLDLPRDGKFRIFNQSRCPLDRFQLIHFSLLSQPHITFMFCPQCYVKSPLFEDPEVSCSLCDKKECEFSLAFSEICECKDCEIGAMYLEPQVPSTQALYISCNQCWVRLSWGVSGPTTRENSKCSNCSSYLVTIKNKNAKTQFKEEVYNKICLFCHPEFKNPTSKKVYKQIGHKTQFRNGGNGKFSKRRKFGNQQKGNRPNQETREEKQLAYQFEAKRTDLLLSDLIQIKEVKPKKRKQNKQNDQGDD